eukprot:jgi/Ulvmu1/1236/UM109_0034.1
MAVIAAAGGAAGYIKKRSIPSGVAGVSFGGLFAVAGYLIDQGNTNVGIPLATGASGICAGYYLLAWMKE